VVFLPDTALLVPGAAGRADPASGLRRAALDALSAALAGPRAGPAAGPVAGPAGPVAGPAGPVAAPGRPVAAPGETPGAPTGRADLATTHDGPTRRVLVIAPARRGRFLPHPVAPGLGAAGLPEPLDPDAAPAGAPRAAPLDPDVAPAGAPRADVPASTALVLLRAAGVRAAVDVLEVERDAAASERAARPVPRTPYADSLAGIVVVGSPSARHGPDAPSPDDPRAPAADAALLAALASGPDALAAALDDLGPAGARDLAVSGGVPWRVALGHLGPHRAVTVTAHHAEVLAGAQHAVVAWSAPAPATAPPAPAAPAPGVPAPAPAEESR